jgi:uncharacterized protein (TIGR03067 family)
MNDVTIVDAVRLTGITKGAFDRDESEPGPIVLQSYPTSFKGMTPGASFRNISIRKLDRESAAAATAKTESSTPAADLNEMQGSWFSIAEEFSGVKSSAQEILKWDRELTVHDDVFSVWRVRDDGKKGILFTGSITLQTSTSPKPFDWTGRVLPEGKPMHMRGIYDYVGDTLRIAYSMSDSAATVKRPTHFASSGTGGGDAYITFERKR